MFLLPKNFLVQNECIFLKFFSFTFTKIEKNYIVFRTHLTVRTYEETAIYYISEKHTRYSAFSRRFPLSARILSASWLAHVITCVCRDWPE